MDQGNKKSLILSLGIFLILLVSLFILVYQVQRTQEIRTRAQSSNCQALSYPCQEGLISFPNDEGTHTDKQVEWWYVNLNTTSASNGYSLAGAVALVRVKQGDGTDRGFALLEMTVKNPGQSFFYRIPTGTITTSAGSQDVSFVAGPGSDINTIKFYQTVNPFEYKLEVTGTDLNIDLALKSNKRPLVEGGDGFVPIFPNYPNDPSYISGYYSLTNISFTDASIALPNLNAFTASGIAWLDHQWFNSPFAPSYITDPFSSSGNHEWFSIQLDNNVQIVAWNIFKDPGKSDFVLKNVDLIDASGNQTHYEDVTIDVPYSWEYWTAPDGKVLAKRWRIFKEGVFDLDVHTSTVDQYVREAKTYEGAAGIRGTYQGQSVTGVGFAEMTLGYPTRPTEPISEICGDAIDNDLDYRIDEFCLAPTPTPTPTSTPAINYLPKGWLDAVTCKNIAGWVCDQNNYNQAIDIHFYRDGPAGGGGTILTSTKASGQRESAVGAECGGNSNHGFNISLPASLIDGKTHSIYAYAINTPSGSNPQLSGSPKSITCTPKKK